MELGWQIFTDALVGKGELRRTAHREGENKGSRPDEDDDEFDRNKNNDSCH